FLAVQDDYILLDLRHPDEITRLAPEENLINIPLEDLPSTYQKLDKDQKIYTLCGSGNRATAAASFLANKGYKPVVIEGGMKAVQEVVYYLFALLVKLVYPKLVFIDIIDYITIHFINK